MSLEKSEKKIGKWLEFCHNCKDMVVHDYSVVTEVFKGEYWLIKRCKPQKHISYKEITGNTLMGESILYQKNKVNYIHGT